MLDAIRYFRGMLGERWRGWQQRSHLARSFHTSFQCGVREWVRLHRLAIALDGLDNVNLVVKELGSPAWQKHIAAEQTLEFCGRIRAAGHRVELIQNTDEVSPDARVWLDNHAITLEFKALHDSDEQMQWDEFFATLQSELFRRRPEGEVFPFWAEFLAPALEHPQDVADTLSKIAANKHSELHYLPHGAGRARYEADTEAREMLFPIAQCDDLDRVTRNLSGKYRRQLRSTETPTLLVVLTKTMFLTHSNRRIAAAREAALKLQKALEEGTMISGLLIQEELFEQLNSPLFHADRTWRLAINTAQGRARTTLLVKNGAANIMLSEHEIDVLIGKHMHW
ncbi:MAG: hypothetical protein R3B48_03005 [Kofleriaceae bacterium]